MSRSPILLLLLLAPSLASAQTWAGCAGGTYKLDFLLDENAQLIKHVMFVEDTMQPDTDWQIMVARFDANRQTIQFSAHQRSGARRLNLQSTRETGRLHANGTHFDLDLKLSCYWAIMNDWPGRERPAH